MRSLMHAALACGLLGLAGQGVLGQAPTPGREARPTITAIIPMPEAAPNQPVSQQLAALQQDVQRLQQLQQAVGQAGDAQTDQQKQLANLQKQIEVQQQMIKLLVDQMGKQEGQTATLEGRGVLAARRDRQLAHAVDDLTEHRAADFFNGPELPAPLKELFDPFYNNETPLSIYGTLAAGYQLFPSRRGEGEFFFDKFSPFFLLQLNDHILMEVEVEFGTSETEVSQAQMDYIVNDWLTVVAGRFLAPIGFFNERLHPAWINKLPDFPLMMRQVTLADFSENGLQLRGSHYLFGSPVKLEYSLYAANGLGVPEEGKLTDLANLAALAETTRDVNEAMAFGGRVGLWVPKYGLAGGFSLYFNRPYGVDQGNDINLWDIDLNYHQGNWDFRLEYAQMFQETTGFLDHNIRRRGLYAQLAYRPLDCCHRILQNLEFVFRYGFARFKGINPAGLQFDAFESPVDLPVDRNQYTFGINYYVYPSLQFKIAYEINQEIHGLDLKDNVFLAQLAWGF
jgi:hypothetical protein